MKTLLRLLATGLAALLSGCALSPAGDASGAADEPRAAVAAAPIDLGGKFAMPDRERGRRDRAAMNAKYQLETEADEQGPPTAAQIFRANAQRREVERSTGARVKAAGLQPTQWVALGPSNVGGRVRALAFDPRNASRLFAGTASGGIWLSTDAGQTWRANNDFLPNLSVTTIVIDPANPDVMYLGTGEASAGLVGVGAFKSVDGGNTWRYLESTNTDANPDWRFVNRLAIHPSQPVLLAALTNTNGATGAIYRSTDGGASWSRVAAFKALDIAFEPSNPANAVAGLDDGTIAYSRDAGITWARSAALVASPSGRSNTARAEIAFARSQAGTVYASVDNAKGEVWRSLDSGATWTKLATPGHLNNQGEYDNAIWVDPTDASHVIVGGLDLYQSRDGGATFAKVSDWRNTPASPHADHHALVSPPDFGPANPALYNGNDGGVYRAANVGDLANGTVGLGWSNLNNGLAVTQFYSGASRTAAGGRVAGGTQDNGALVMDAGLWRPFRGGDGGFVAVDPVSDATIYGEYVYLSIHRSVNGLPAQYICNGITEGLPNEEGFTYCGANATKQANFIAPFILDPNNPNRMLAGANSLWVSDGVRTGSPSWRTIKPPSTTVAENYINAIAVHEGNGNLVYVGHNNGEVFRSTDALGPAPTWTRVGQGVLPGRRVQRITIDRANPNRVIVAVTGFVANNVLQTLDGGATWASITSNLPNAPVFDVKMNPRNPAWLYAATSVGIFTSENGGASWSTTNEGPANIRVRELFWMDDNTLGAATYGRGMYKAAVASTGPANYQDLWWAGATENGWGMSITQHGSTLFIAFYIYDAQGRAQWVVMSGGNWNAGFTAYTGALYQPNGAYFGAYDASRFSVNAPVGTATVAFTSLTTATLTYTINGVSGTKSIQRQVFGPQDATPTASYADLWWGGVAQNGWGVAISQQYRKLFAVWYTYDAAGRTTWFVVPDGTWTNATTYTGTAYRTTSSAWLGVPYVAASLSVVPVGSVTFSFTDLHNAVMSYDVEGVSQSKPIVRQPF